MSKLTSNCIKSIYFGETEGRPDLQTPAVQILNVKKFASTENSQDRYRLLLSDGTHYMNGMVTLNVCPQIASGDVGKDTVIRLLTWTLSNVNSRKILLILNMEVVSRDNRGRMGEPVNIETIDPNVPKKDTKQQPVPVAARQAQPPAKQPQSHYQMPVQQKVAADPNPFANAVVPIKSINPYQNKWTLKVRVTNKSDLRTYTNAKGEGKLFSITLIDESGEIKATAFNEVAVKLYPMVEENKVYYITKGQVKAARKQFSTVQNDYEISMDQNTEITPCNDASVPNIRYNFVPIERLPDYQKDSIVDVIAIVKSIGELQNFTSKATQRQSFKRDLVLLDQSSSSVNMTIWGKLAEHVDFTENSVVAFKGVKTSDFNGCSLSAMGGSSHQVNPDIPEAHRIRGWFDSTGGNVSVHSMTTAAGASSKRAGGITRERKYLVDIQQDNLGQQEKPDYLTVRAMTGVMKSDKSMWYAACPGDNCQKKVIEENGEWRCEKCQRSYPNCEYRYIMNMNIIDATGTAWAQCFNDNAEKILGHSAAELNQLKENDNIDGFHAVLNAAAHKLFVFTLRIKQEIYNDESRIRSSIFSCEPVNFVEESNYLANLIEQY